MYIVVRHGDDPFFTTLANTGQTREKKKIMLTESLVNDAHSHTILSS